MISIFVINILYVPALYESAFTHNVIKCCNKSCPVFSTVAKKQSHQFLYKLPKCLKKLAAVPNLLFQLEKVLLNLIQASIC